MNRMRRDDRMDLKNNRVTVGEVLAYPGARALLKKELPDLANSPLLGLAKNMPLSNVIRIANGKISPDQMVRLLDELKKL